MHASEVKERAGNEVSREECFDSGRCCSFLSSIGPGKAAIVRKCPGPSMKRCIARKDLAWLIQIGKVRSLFCCDAAIQNLQDFASPARHDAVNPSADGHRQ